MVEHQTPETEAYADEIDLFKSFEVFWRRRWSFVIIVNILLILTAIYTFWFSKAVYEAEATLMPLKSSGSGMTSVINNLVPASLMPFPLSRAEEDVSRFVNILQSRMLAEAVTHRLDLAERLYSQTPPEDRPPMQRIVESLRKGVVQATVDRTWLVHIKAQSDSPELAADIANAYVQHLRRHLKENTVTESRRNRIFIEEQYHKALNELETAEHRLQAFKETHKVFSISAQLESLIEHLGILKGNLTAKEIEFNVLTRSGISTNNPSYKSVNYEVEELRQKIRDLEKGSEYPSSLTSVPLEALPQIEREVAKLMRNKVIQETLSSLLAQQYKQAQIAEEKDEIRFATLDAALPPLVRVKPNRRLHLMAGGILGMICATAYVIMQATIERHGRSET